MTYYFTEEAIYASTSFKYEVKSREVMVEPAQLKLIILYLVGEMLWNQNSKAQFIP